MWSNDYVVFTLLEEHVKSARTRWRVPQRRRHPCRRLAVIWANKRFEKAISECVLLGFVFGCRLGITYRLTIWAVASLVNNALYQQNNYGPCSAFIARTLRLKFHSRIVLWSGAATAYLSVFIACGFVSLADWDVCVCVRACVRACVCVCVLP